MSGWFELKKASDGQFQFVLKAGNAEIILTSELYKSKPSAQSGIASVQANCGNDDRYEKLESKNGKAYFNLKAANHQIIGTSQMYSSAGLDIGSTVGSIAGGGVGGGVLMSIIGAIKKAIAK